MRHWTARIGIGAVWVATAALACGGTSPTGIEDTAAGGTGGAVGEAGGGGGAGEGGSGSGPATDAGLPAAFAEFGDGVVVYEDGDEIVIESDGVPDHGSPYFPAGDPRYEAYDGPNDRFALNPNRIAEQRFVFRIPRDPEVADAASPTPLGPIGVAVNGVAIFNQYAGPNRPLTFEIDSFDQYNGHPQQTGVYHYHVEPLWITSGRGADALIGFLLDGFPVYGPEEDGRRLTNADLDALHGHFGPTAHWPDGIYHYHVTDEDPYINGAGFRGTAGSVAQ